MRVYLSIVVSALLVAAAVSFAPARRLHLCRPFSVSSSSTQTSDDFSSFAASLEEDTTKTSSQNDASTSTTFDQTDSASKKNTSWQADLEELLDPATSLARRQILLSDLMGEREEIRSSVQAALRDRKIDPLLTPTGRKIQDGTKAVARQLTNDILPGLTAADSPSPLPGLLRPPTPDQLTKVGSRILNAAANQMQKSFEQLQSDLQDPASRIPARLYQQTDTLVKEASNVFSEMPAGLKEPAYTLVRKTADYEIRDYEAYTVASTNMAGAEEVYQPDNVAMSGQGFNSLAAYLFGANADQRAMDMTTPVTTTMSGEMRFYLWDDKDVPDPLAQDEAKSAYETGSILIQEIPAARLAVRRFTGFVTAGEVERQKDALLSALALDNVELDVPHGSAVGHVIFQYNPPYTLPVIRRNEIAVPVVADDEKERKQDPWETTTTTTTTNGSTEPSD